ncbi:MAG TPA: TVP38/TMEM64 family protein [Thermoanaerobaculia bacterium]
MIEWLREFQDYVRGLGALGYVVYTLGYGIVGTFFPASILTIGAGALFGVVAGTIVVASGATIAATIAFILARTILRKRVESMAAANPKFRAVDRAIAREGIKIVILVRLAAVFPFLFMNYAFGLTGIGTMQYVGATFVGILPATVAFVYLGAAGAAVAEQNRTKTIITIVGLVIAFATSIFVGRVAARAIKRAGVDDALPSTPE